MTRSVLTVVAGLLLIAPALHAQNPLAIRPDFAAAAAWDASSDMASASEKDLVIARVCLH